MKSERKRKVQEALRFFSDGGDLSRVLVEEVRRLRRELKKVNKVNERYSRALGLLPMAIPEDDVRTPYRRIKSLEKQVTHLNKSLRQAEDEVEHWKSVAAEKNREVAYWKTQALQQEDNAKQWKRQCDGAEKDVEDLEMSLEDAELQLKATTDNVREFEKEIGVWTEQREFWTLCARVQALIRNNETLYKELQRWEGIAADEKKKRREIEKEAKEFARMIIKEST